MTLELHETPSGFHRQHRHGWRYMDTETGRLLRCTRVTDQHRFREIVWRNLFTRLSAEKLKELWGEALYRRLYGLVHGAPPHG